MAENVSLIPTSRLVKNPENPRLIFHQEELEELQQSIAEQGILVPLTVYQDSKKYFLLDGERRWRCALKLGLETVPVIVQPKPDRMRNLMIMFATHKARKDWDPLPTAIKLRDLEEEFESRYGKSPNEKELAGIASISRGEVRRLKKLLGLPGSLINMLLKELDKPRSEQRITVDQVLEATKGAEALRKRDIIDEDKETDLRDSLISKFKAGTINSTVDPRKLVRIARAVEREELDVSTALRAINRLISSSKYSIDDAFNDTVAKADYVHSTMQLAARVLARLREGSLRRRELSDSLIETLEELASEIKKIL